MITRKEFMIGAGSMAATASAMTCASIGGVSGRARGLMGGAFMGAMLARQGKSYTIRDYVQTNLLSMWDGIQNDGIDNPHKLSGTWVDLCGSGLNFDIAQNTWGDDGVKSTINNTKGSFYNSPLLQHLTDPLNGTTGWTCEFVGNVSNVYMDSTYQRVFMTSSHDTSSKHTIGLKFLNYSNYISASWAVLYWNNRGRSVNITAYVGTGKPFSITHTITSDLSEKIYINGTKKYEGTVSQITAYSLSNDYLIFNGIAGRGGFTGTHHCYRIYSSGGLTDAQVAHNYAVDKARFGLA